jgi:hypothetical protein
MFGNITDCQNYVHEEIMNKLNLGNTVQKLFLSRLLFKNIKIKMCIAVILPVVLYGFKTSSLAHREERR